MYNCLVGPGVPVFRDVVCRSDALRFDSPKRSIVQTVVWGAKAKPPVSDIGWRLCCKRAHACCRARLTMTVLLPFAFFVIFVALVLAVFLLASQEI